MRFRLLIFFIIMGASTDLAPDNLFKCDGSLDEIQVLLSTVIEQCDEILCSGLNLLMDEIYLLLEFYCVILTNVNSYFVHNMYIWLLFHSSVNMFKHPIFGVRSHYLRPDCSLCPG